MVASYHIGTSGWHYPHWQGPSYPRELAPAGFTFALKASRYITHMKNLRALLAGRGT